MLRLSLSNFCLFFSFLFLPKKTVERAGTQQCTFCLQLTQISATFWGQAWTKHVILRPLSVRNVWALKPSATKTIPFHNQPFYSTNSVFPMTQITLKLWMQAPFYEENFSFARAKQKELQITIRIKHLSKQDK